MRRESGDVGEAERFPRRTSFSNVRSLTNATPRRGGITQEESDFAGSCVMPDETRSGTTAVCGPRSAAQDAEHMREAQVGAMERCAVAGAAGSGRMETLGGGTAAGGDVPAAAEDQAVVVPQHQSRRGAPRGPGAPDQRRLQGPLRGP